MLWLWLCLLVLVSCWPTRSDVKINISLQINVSNANSRAKASQCELLRPNGEVIPHKVLLFVDSPFFNLFRNWMAYHSQACGNTTSVEHLEIVCMDHVVEVMLDGMNLKCSAEHSSALFSSAGKGGHRNSLIWMRRLEIINKMLSKGMALILSDTDALWLKSPYADLNRHLSSSLPGPGAAIVASRGWFPFSLSRRWGSTLCMGFMYIQASAFSIHFFDQVLANMLDKQRDMDAHRHWLATKETTYVDSSNHTMRFDPAAYEQQENKVPDDQYSANMVLASMNISWPRELYGGNRLDPHTGVVQFRGQPQYITLLPERDYVRNCFDNPLTEIDKLKLPTRVFKQQVKARTADATVVHCLIAPGDSKLKQMYMFYYQLWKLPTRYGELRRAIGKEQGRFGPPKPLF